MKKFFGIEKNYEFEWNDLRAILNVINVALIIKYGLSIAWFGFLISLFGLVKDLITDRHINGIILHLSSLALNIYFLFFI